MKMKVKVKILIIRKLIYKFSCHKNCMIYQINSNVKQCKYYNSINEIKSLNNLMYKNKLYIYLKLYYLFFLNEKTKLILKKNI